MDMGTISAAGMERDGFLGEVDFKWLMAGQGCWIDPDRLHSDRAYASDCLKTALNSSCDVLRSCARFLQVELLSCT